MSTLERGPGSVESPRRWRLTEAGTDAVAPTLAQRYAWYCDRQVSMLLALLSREGLRDLYATARQWATDRREHESKDPMATLRRYCRVLLPLPPFEVWELDFRANRGAYLEDDLDPPGLRSRGAPVTVETRSVVHLDRPWTVELRLFSDGDVWRGFMVFRSGVGPAFSTADVFCEATPQHIRERFQEFAPDTLAAFLRSALP